MVEAEEPRDNTEANDGQATIVQRRSSGDPAFGFLLALAVSVGLIPLLPANADLRYTLSWGALAAVSILAWLLGNMDRIGQERPDNLFWGMLFGVFISIPFNLFAGGTLGRAAQAMFIDMGLGTILAYLVFVMPLGETLFFRGLVQRNLDFYIVGVLGGIWNVVLFFPVMWSEIVASPPVALYLIIALLAMNLLLSYVRERNGLAAAWIGQIVAVLVLFFLPLIGNQVF